MIILLTIIFLGVITIKMNEPVPITNPIIASQEDFSHLTNPDYLASPGEFVIDKGNDISVAPPNVIKFPDSLTGKYLKEKYPQTKTPVWVEDVLDENTIKVSYPVTMNGEKFLTFAAISLYGLGDMSDGCESTKTIAFLKSILKGKNVYLANIYGTYEKEDCRKNNVKFEQFAQRYPIMSKKLYIMDVYMQETDLKSVIASQKIYLSKDSALRGADLNPFPIVEVNISKSVVASGYGALTVDIPVCTGAFKIAYSSAIPSNYFEQEIEAAKVSKRGLRDEKVCDVVQ